MTNEVVIKIMTVENEPREVFDFFVDVKNWETGGVLTSVTKSGNGWWTFNSPGGSGMLRMKDNSSAGILDHRFFAGGIDWDVFCRVHPNQSGSTVVWTFVRPNSLSINQFESQLQNFDREIEGWKSALTKLKEGSSITEAS
jgi:hypothetical protein